MPFPDSKRVFYGKNPLVEVVCQLRFPPILRIDSEAPAAFQEKIRVAFPLYQRTVTQPQLGLPALPQPILQMIAGAGSATHEFVSADEVWKVSLARDFLALTTNRYHDWQDFTSRLKTPLEALASIYAPAFFQRIGLRYQDRIDRGKLGLKDVAWSELLKPHILGELGDPLVAASVRHVLRELTVELSEARGKVRIVHGLDDDDGSYVIDADFYTENKTPVEGAGDVLNGFNKRAGRLFRWCITKRLHDAMDPKDV